MRVPPKKTQAHFLGKPQKIIFPIFGWIPPKQKFVTPTSHDVRTRTSQASQRGIRVLWSGLKDNLAEVWASPRVRGSVRMGCLVGPIIRVDPGEVVTNCYRWRYEFFLMLDVCCGFLAMFARWFVYLWKWWWMANKFESQWWKGFSKTSFTDARKYIK